jgi:hypothetical protein
MSHRVLRRLLVVGCAAGVLLIPVASALAWIACQTPKISTSASWGTVGHGIHDMAVLSGGSSPGGTISWQVYSATDMSCSNPLTSTPLKVSVSGDGTYTSPDFTPSSAGSYQWVATYSGDGKNAAVSTSCNDRNEVSSVSKASPAISTSASPGTVGQGIHDVATLSGGYAPMGTITWTVFNTSDKSCSTPLSSSSLTVNGDGTYTSPDFMASSPGSYQWVATYSGDGNNGSVASQCNDSSEVSMVQPAPGPVQPAPGSGIDVLKLQRVGSSGSFTTGTVTAQVGQTIQYEIQVTNTGNAPLTLSLNDPHCNAGTIQGPFVISGTLTGDVLSPGGEAKYTCSHVLTSSDSSPFTNTAMVTGQPPTGPAVSGTSSVTASKAAVKPVKIVKCKPGHVKKTKKVHGKTVAVCVAKKKGAISREPKKPMGFTG